jgi:hypothetical protein
MASILNGSAKPDEVFMNGLLAYKEVGSVMGTPA